MNDRYWKISIPLVFHSPSEWLCRTVFWPCLSFQVVEYMDHTTAIAPTLDEKLHSTHTHTTYMSNDHVPVFIYHNFGHVIRLAEDALVNASHWLGCQMDSGYRPSGSWKRMQGRPPFTWLNQIACDFRLKPKLGASEVAQKLRMVEGDHNGHNGFANSWWWWWWDDDGGGGDDDTIMMINWSYFLIWANLDQHQGQRL